MIHIKAGVKVGGLKPEMLLVLAVLPPGATLTGACEDAPGRLPDSLHKSGYAVDIRQMPGLFEILDENLSDEYDVVPYDSHIHVEYDP